MTKEGKRIVGLAMQPGDMVKLVIIEGDGCGVHEYLMMYQAGVTFEGMERVTRALRRAIRRNNVYRGLIRFLRWREYRTLLEREAGLRRVARGRERNKSECRRLVREDAGTGERVVFPGGRQG